MTGTDDYANVVALHKGHADAVTSLIEKLLFDAGLTPHTVTHRVKSEESARNKVVEQPSKFGSASDLHDLLGVRVITHLSSDVSKVVAVLEREFAPEQAMSVDKAAELNADEFGYSSFHLVVRLGQSRAELPEWRSFASARFEIQVRSILQHAWAEIEHDLGYKTKGSLPREVERRFARLAGLLELADDEFDRLTVESKDHANGVREAVSAGIDVAIDRDSVHAVLAKNSLLRSIDRRIAASVGRTVAKKPESGYVNMRASELNEVGIRSVDELLAVCAREKENIIRFASDWLNANGGRAQQESSESLEKLSPGIGLFYLYLHLKIEIEQHNFSAVPAKPDSDEDDYGIDSHEAAASERESLGLFLSLHDQVFGASSRGKELGQR